jgi:hypothetical protein
VNNIYEPYLVLVVTINCYITISRKMTCIAENMPGCISIKALPRCKT